MKKKPPKLSIALYVLAGILVAYAGWALFHIHTYVSGMITQNQFQFSGNEYNVVDFYISGSVQYVVYAIILMVLGRILQISYITTSLTTVNENKEIITEEVDNPKKEDNDDWFEFNNKT